MEVKLVVGRKLGDLFLYALSTCVWCKKTKGFLNELGVEYRYVDVDLVPEDDREEIVRMLARWNQQRSYPTLVVNRARCIVGFKPEEIKEALGL